MNVLKTFSLISLLILLSVVATFPNSPIVVGASFEVKEYEEFHRVLHPLEHEALPKQDFPRIRAKADELVKLGNMIVELGVPPGTSEANVEGFKTELKRFSDSLVRFSADAKNGTDEQLKGSFDSVHDSFEMLMGMLPRS